MANTIKCQNCGNIIDVAQELAKDIRESIVLEERRKTNDEIEKVRKQANKELSDLLDQISDLKRKDDQREIEMKKKLLESESEIKNTVRKEVFEEHQLKDREKDQKLQEALKQVEELKSKIQQGSQQTQGETLELQIEERLRRDFPNDIIEEVKKGVRGADIIQTVVDKLGRNCGKIVWESKNAKWSETWISKLKDDQRQEKADLACLVSVNLPQNIESFSYYQGVWIASPKSFSSLALALRFNLVNIYYEKQNAKGVDEKMKVLYTYLTGNEFKQRVEAIVEAFAVLQDDIEKEKRWFALKWAKQEKEIRKVIDNTHGLYGDFQGTLGNSLPEIKTLGEGLD